MKKLFALLLVLCMLVGLVACGKKDPTSSNNPTNPTTDTTDSGNAEDPQLSMTPDKSPYNGKSLQVYGMGSTPETYTNYDQYGKGSYKWMMKAAMEEWGAMNGVTIEYKGSYNESAVLAEINAGAKPDLVFHDNMFPAIANNGIAGQLTDEEYAKLATVCDEDFLNLFTYNGKSCGFVYPWTGTFMVYYNKSMFENYGVKTPKEYFLEGTWTWENFAKCMDEMTKDVNADGTIDTYGTPSESWTHLVNPWKTDETGKVISTIDEEWMQDYYQLKYDSFTVKQVVLNPGKNQITKNVTYPMYAMQISDCEPYNFQHMYQTLANGDELEVVPAPEWRGDNGETLGTSQLTQSGVNIVTCCDERDAAVDMLLYVLKCGLKYMSDYSLGAVKCDYVGMQGKSDLSKKWVEKIGQVCAERAAAIKEIATYDAEYVTKVNEYLSERGYYIEGKYAGVTALYDFSDIIKMPPASSIPTIKAKYQAQLDTYNDTYVK